MSQETIADMPGIEAAMDRFADFEESKPATTTATDKTPATREPQPPDAQAADDKSQAQNSDSPSPDTRATAAEKPVAVTEKPTDQTKPDPAKPAEEAKPDANQSRYAKSQERLTKTWDQVNADKTALATEKTRLETERADFARQKAEFETIRQQAQQPQYKPEDYLNASRQKKAAADHQRAEAKRLEDAGKFAEAEKLNKLATKNDALSEDLAEHADNLRRNPPQGLAERTQQYEKAKQAWTVEAAKAFPDLAKDNSPFQQTVAGHLNALAKSDPQLLAHPSVIYHVARLVAAEGKVKAVEAEAARVPVLMKEAESLRAKIKELEALTTPAGGGSVARIGSQSAGDDEASLRQAAAEQPSIFR